MGSGSLLHCSPASCQSHQHRRSSVLAYLESLLVSRTTFEACASVEPECVDVLAHKPSVCTIHSSDDIEECDVYGEYRDSFLRKLRVDGAKTIDDLADAGILQLVDMYLMKLL